MKKFLFNDYAVWQNEIYYFDIENCLPCKMDTETGKIRYIEMIKNYHNEENVSMDNMVCHNGIVYALRMSGDGLVIWDIKKNSCKYVHINYKEKPGENFAYICDINDGVYIFPKHKSEIFWVNKEGNIEKILYDKKELGDIICGCRVNKKIYLFPREGNKFVLFDIEKQECELISLKIKLNKIISCTTKEETIYILNKERDVYVLDSQNKEVKHLDYECSYKGEKSVVKVLLAGNKLLVFPLLAEDIQIIDLQTNKIERYLNYPEDFYYSDVAWSNYYGCTEDDKYYYLLRKSNYLLRVDKETAEFKWTKLFASEDSEEMRIQMDYGKKDFFEKNISMESFINMLLREEAGYVEAGIDIGKIIWKQAR